MDFICILFWLLLLFVAVYIYRTYHHDIYPSPIQSKDLGKTKTMMVVWGELFNILITGLTCSLLSLLSFINWFYWWHLLYTMNNSPTWLSYEFLLLYNYYAITCVQKSAYLQKATHSVYTLIMKFIGYWIFRQLIVCLVTFMCIYKNIYIYTYIQLIALLVTFMCVYIYIHTYIYIYIYIIHIYICICIFSSIST